MSKTNLTPLILVLCLTLTYSGVRADEGDYSAAHYVAAGLLLVDVGASVANGFSLTTGRPNRLNGYFGVVVGVASLGAVALDYALTEDKELRDSFALVCGTAGTVSIVLGVMNVWRAPPARERTSEASEVHVFPYLTMERDHRYGMGIGARMTF